MYKKVSRKVPNSVRGMWRTVTSHRYSTRERQRRPSEETIEWLVEMLRGDMDALRELLNDPIREWGGVGIAPRTDAAVDSLEPLIAEKDDG